MRKNEKGFALVLSLILLLVMSLMGGALIVISAGDHKSNNVSDEYQQTFYVAETALFEGEKYLINQFLGPYQSNGGGKRDTSKRDFNWFESIWKRTLKFHDNDIMIAKLFSVSANCPSFQKRFKDAKILYMEGYLWDKPSSKSAFLNAAKINKESGGLNSISLSDVFCVEMHRDSFISFIADDIDYVFCNEDELNSLTLQSSTNESFKYFEEKFPKVKELICTLGSEGAVILKNGERHSFEATETRVVDKTGAGDFFAAGYLYGLQKDLSVDKSANFANKSAAHVISEIGVRPKRKFN